MLFVGKTTTFIGRSGMFIFQCSVKRYSYVNFSMRFTKYQRKIFLVHLVFWMVYLMSNSYLWQTFDKTYNQATLYGLTRLPVKIVAVYINLYLLNQFFFKKRYYTFSVLFLLNLFAAGLVQSYLSGPHPFNYESFTQYSLPVCSVVMLTSVLIIIRRFFVKVDESRQLEIEKIKSELNFLKTQFQPHFLFNTLNNIYSLTFNNGQLAGKSILQLSALLRYMLYETGAEIVELEKEIDHLADYIELEKMRFASRLELSFNISGQVSGKKIAPLLLMPVLENAFKHASSKLDEKIWITVDLIVKDTSLYFTVENSVFPDGKMQMQKTYSGIGWENLKRRLSILYKDYTLNHELNESSHHAFLMLPLNS
jgi:two-component system, LytTR family, sensor kinase